MATLIRSLLCAAALIFTALVMAQSTEPAAPPVKGCVLLLPNEHILEGEITQVGQQYCIAREGSGQTWLPCSKARRLFASRADAYQYLRTQANLDDPDERLRLAQWCILYELRPHALAELKAANELRPNDGETRRLLAQVERLVQVASTPPPPAPTPTPVPRPESRNDKAAEKGQQLNVECMGLFARRVQPILMNTCARCHASAKAGEFKLTQVFGDAPISGRSSQQNLIAVLSQIKSADPMDSPLLRMAASAHGGSGQPPLRNRETPAYRTLEQWVHLTAAHAPKAIAVMSDASPVTTERQTKNIFENREKKKDEPTVKKETSAIPKESFASDTREKPSGPTDEFDPIIFNRLAHPEKK